jgi:hypothetical protein
MSVNGLTFVTKSPISCTVEEEGGAAMNQTVCIGLEVAKGLMARTHDGANLNTERSQD